MMPAAKYRGFALAANHAEHHGKPEFNANDGYRYSSAFKNAMSRNEDVTYIHHSDSYLTAQTHVKTNEYVNLRTYPEEAHMAPRPTRSHDSKTDFLHEKCDNAHSSGGNFYLAVDLQSNCRDYDQRSNACSGVQSYENYPLCTSFNNHQCSSAPVYSSRELLHREERDYANIPCHVSQQACHRSRQGAGNDQTFIERSRTAAGHAPLSELDYAIEHCRKAEAEQFQLKENTYLNSSSICDTQQQVIDGQQYRPRDFRVCEAVPFSNRFQGPHQHCQRPDGRHMTEHPKSPNVYTRNDLTYTYQESKPNSSTDPAGGRQRPSPAIVSAISAQIQTLREEMLELRSTTMAFKLHMEKMFEELATLNTMNSRDFLLKSPGSGLTATCSELTKFLTTSSFGVAADRSGSKRSANEMYRHDDVTTAHALGPNSSQVIHVREALSEDSATAYVIKTSAQDLAAQPAVHQTPVHATPEREKRSKTTSERPNSDSFATMVESDKDFHSSGPTELSTMSLPHANSTIAQKKFRGLDQQRDPTRTCKSGSGENVRILPVLSHSNATLHTSECSIDSGYQGSSIATPRERGRELTSQVVTPASPISESPVEAAFTKREDEVAESGGVHCKGGDIEITSVCPTGNSFTAEEAGQDVFYEGGDALKSNYLTSQHLESLVNARCAKSKAETVGIDEEAPEIVRTVCAKPRDPYSCKKSTSSCSDSGDDLLRADRPVPKPRRFAKGATQAEAACIDLAADCDYEAAPDSVANPSYEPYSEAQTVPKVELQDSVDSDRLKADTMHLLGAPDQDSGSVRVTGGVESDGNPSAPSKQPSVQCITVLKQQQQQQQRFYMTPALSSAVQNRVKLGVSAISAQHREQAMLDEPRQRKTIHHAKQALREKFAAVLEHSAAKNRNCATIIDEDEAESSVIRRRSMRMMTEFQIYDFQDSSVGLSSILQGESGKAALRQPEVSGSSLISKSAPGNAENSSCPVVSHSKGTTEAVTVRNASAEERPKRQQFVNSDQKTNRSAISQAAPSETRRNAKMTQGSFHASLPLPPPPPPPPASPPTVANRPPSVAESHASVFSEIELVPPKRPTILHGPPLLRPKAALPGVSCDLNASQASAVAGKKISPSIGSAFTPVLSASLRSLPVKPSPITERYDMHCSAESESGPVEFKRRASLPIGSVSNKGKYLNETQHVETENQPCSSSQRPVNDDELQQRHAMPLRSSLRKTQNKTTEALESIISAEEANVTSYSVYAASKLNCDVAPVASNSVDRAAAKVTCDGERRRHVSADRGRSSSATRAAARLHNLENQPVRYNRKDNIKQVVSALRSAGYLASEFAPQQVYETANSSNNLAINYQPASDAESATQASTQPFARTGKPERSSGRSNSRTRSKDESHRREPTHSTGRAAVPPRKLETDNVISAKPPQHTIQENSSQPHSGQQEPTTPTRSHRSTVAMLRASLMGRKTQRSATTDGKRDFTTKVEVKTRSASASSKTWKRVDDLGVEGAKTSRKSLDAKTKDASKKSKAEAKQRKEKSSSKKSGKNTGTAKKEAKQDLKASSDLLPPDSDDRHHGNADSEVMERFLAAAAASHNPRSPLQKLRSSFRTPRNKAKLQQASHSPRIKDDMDIAPLAGAPGQAFSLGRGTKKIPPLREDTFTYV